jgi:molybdopterin-guanine dinucleotide biosynthesis protein A
MVELCEDVIVLAASTANEQGAFSRSAGVRFVRDDEAFPGPLVAVARGLAAARHDVTLVVAGDMPLVPLRVLALIASELSGSGLPVCGLAVGGEIQQLPIGVRRDAIRDWLTAKVAAGERRLGALARLEGALAIAEPVWRALDTNGDSLRDIDTEEDLAALLREPSED